MNINRLIYKKMGFCICTCTPACLKRGTCVHPGRVVVGGCDCDRVIVVVLVLRGRQITREGSNTTNNDGTGLLRERTVVCVHVHQSNKMNTLCVVKELMSFIIILFYVHVCFEICIFLERWWLLSLFIFLFVKWF